jgi:hypothetical protein
MGESRTSKFYASHPKAAAKRRESQKKINSTTRNKKYRAECNAARKKLGLKKGDGMDASHTKKGTVVKEKRTLNRGRNGANGKSTKK